MIYGPTLDPWCQRLHLRTWWKVPLPSQCLSFFSLPSLPSILQISSSRHLPGQTGHTPRFELWSAAIIYEDWRRIAPVHKWWWQDTPAPQCPSLSSPKMSSQAGFPSSYKQIRTKTNIFLSFFPLYKKQTRAHLEKAISLCSKLLPLRFTPSACEALKV